MVFGNVLVWLVLVCGFCLDLSSASGFCSSTVPESHGQHHHCDHGHDHRHHHKHHAHDHHQHHHHKESLVESKLKLPEELAEEEDMSEMEWEHCTVDSKFMKRSLKDDDYSPIVVCYVELNLYSDSLGLWMNALGCSFLVSMASLVCLTILPVIFVQGKPSKAVVDSLALFGAGAMLGDAFLHQLPHAFAMEIVSPGGQGLCIGGPPIGAVSTGGGHSHSHDHHDDHVHDEHHLHAHSLADLSVGISVLAGIVLFLLVEKVVRYVEDYSGGTNAWSHTHHHHHHKKSKKLKDDNDMQSQSSDGKDSTAPNNTSEEKVPDDASHNSLKEDTQQESYIRKRRSTADRDDKEDVDTAKLSASDIKVLNEKEHSKPSSNLVIGYLNLFSDGVHNFTDGIALGSAFLLYGSVGGWSRTLFLLAHELPQEAIEKRSSLVPPLLLDPIIEHRWPMLGCYIVNSCCEMFSLESWLPPVQVGDFGILVRSGFSVSKALFFNFLSALVALAGTAMALLLGKDPGQSSLIEGFTAGGFIYIAVAGVLAEMNNNGSSTVKSTGIHLISLILGMGVALCISLVE
ncbi:hypothetical protein FEM48_Zijuj10G0110700 [Ziziphus jujuba var. spinosa]|uniref:IAA-alanine resistance protein 1 n=1 Tax=Ziziphus jujuba var. spinosa TaxID=714518 RepID=A0A978UN04_ZIZJJ|nr:hypothetical protein FEM48_Zijuj10G0110700 [Ziziphus jujuba var. spinosa]